MNEPTRMKLQGYAGELGVMFKKSDIQAWAGEVMGIVEGMDALQDAFIKGDEFIVRFCVSIDNSGGGCDSKEHPHFEAFDWTMRDGPVFAKTLRDVIDAAIAVREGVNDGQC